jgi:siroheme synthase-like protein
VTTFFPINVSLKDKLVIIIGGGKVALRKARSLLPYGPIMKIIAKEVVYEELYDLRKEFHNIEIIEKEAEVNDLKHAFLVVVATDNQVLNDKISRELDKENILVNSVTKGGNVIFPAIHKKGDIVISVSTSGVSPAFASKIRDEIAGIFGDEWIQVLQMMKEYRNKAKKLIRNKEKRAEIINQISEILLQENSQD